MGDATGGGRRWSWGGLAARIVVVALATAGLARALLFLVYMLYQWHNLKEVYYLESKMVHLAWRVQHGVRLYPPWRTYPHVANFFGPCYFALVGLLGRACGSSLDGLFRVARTVSDISTLGIPLVVGVYAGRRWGVVAGIVGAMTSLGAGPMIGYGVMGRPDAMAELLGVGGFFLVLEGRRKGLVAGALCLVLAVFTKQTAAMYLAAAALGLLAEGRRMAALSVLAGCLLAVIGFAATVTLTLEPEFAPSLLGEGQTPWSVLQWRALLWRFAVVCPDLIVFAIVGLGLWCAGPTRDPRLAALASLALGTSILASGKRGADLNYFLSLCPLEGLAAASLAAAVLRVEGARAWLLAAGSAVGLAALLFSTHHVWYQASFINSVVERYGTREGVVLLQENAQLARLAADPETRLLTDQGWIDIHQGRRTLFGDPWLFRMLVETGRIRPDQVRTWIEEERYDWIITQRSLASTSYATFEFGLPPPLVEPALRHYVEVASHSGVYLYRPRKRASRR